jgi:acyl carrier protein
MVTTTDIEREIHNFILDNFLFGKDGGLKPSDSLIGKGVIDSTGVLELVSFLQERYEIYIEDEEVIPDNLDSIMNLATFVSRKLSSRACGGAHAG